MKIREKVKAATGEELKEIIAKKRQELEQELAEISNKNKRKVYENQNKVREAVMGLLLAEDLFGGIGRQVSEIASEFENSLKNTIELEEKIQSRNQIKTFFFGGDKASADKLREEAEQNRERIRQLINLRESCECQEEVGQILAEQIQNLEQEQNRLMEIAQKQLAANGVFGWLIGWFKK